MSYTFDNGFPGTAEYVFISWDSLGDVSTEATYPSKLGMLMPDHLFRIAKTLQPDEVRKLPNGHRLMRN